MSLKLYWLSWFQPTEDHRPLNYPPNQAILGWWNTGSRMSDGYKTMVAYVIATDEEDAKESVMKDWPEAVEWRFINERDRVSLSDRFPCPDWSKERIENHNGGAHG